MPEVKPTYTVWTAGVLVGFYLIMTAFMFWYAGGDIAVWQQRLVVYNGFTAFAATAAGVLLGTQIQQANVTEARAELAENKAGIKALLEDIGQPGSGGGAEAMGATDPRMESLRRGLVDLL
jgi:hypothetical protein